MSTALFVVGVVLLLVGGWPSIARKTFPYNLPFIFVGGLLFGFYGVGFFLQ
jgi:hypothetical protein